MAAKISAQATPDMAELYRQEDSGPAGQSAEKPGFPARMGETILRTLRIALQSDEPPAISRWSAAIFGIGTAFARLVLTLGIFGLAAGLVWLWCDGTQSVMRPLDFKPQRFSSDTRSVAMIAAVFAAGGILLFGCWLDVERKGRILSWLLFALTAAVSVMATNYRLVTVLVLAGQFSIHYFIHSALDWRYRMLMHRMTMEREATPAPDTGVRQTLLARYQGVAGFENPDEPGEATEKRR